MLRWKPVPEFFNYPVVLFYHIWLKQYEWHILRYASQLRNVRSLLRRDIIRFRTPKFQQVQKQYATMALAHHSQSPYQADQRLKTEQQTRKVTGLSIRSSYNDEQVLGYTRPLLQGPQCTAQDQRRITQQMMIRRLTKQPPMEKQLVIGHRNSVTGETLIRKQWSRRPRIGQHLRSVPKAWHGPPEMSMSIENAPNNETSIYLTHKPHAMLKQVEQDSPLDNKPKSKGHYNLKCQPNDQIKPKSCRIVIMNMNQGMQGRRATIQHGSSDYECSGRRNALCKQRFSPKRTNFHPCFKKTLLMKRKYKVTKKRFNVL